MAKIIVTNGPPGITPTTLKLFAETGDTVLQTAVPTVGINDTTLVSASFLSLAAGRYRCVVYQDTTELGTDHVTVREADGTYQCDELVSIATLLQTDGVRLANDVTHGGTSAVLSLKNVLFTTTGLTPSIEFAGSGSGDGFSWTRSGAGEPLDAAFVQVVIDTLETKAQADARQALLIAEHDATQVAIAAIDVGGGDATAANQDAILAAIYGSSVIQIASPNVQGNLVLTQGDTYDGIGNPKAQWVVTTDYTDGWAVTFTIRDASDVVVYTVAGEVVNATTIAVAIVAPTGLTMTGCPGQWQGKFDVELTKADSTKTIALGTVYINEDQTR